MSHASLAKANHVKLEVIRIFERLTELFLNIYLRGFFKIYDQPHLANRSPLVHMLF